MHGERGLGRLQQSSRPRLLAAPDLAACGAKQARRVPALSSETRPCRMAAAQAYRAEQQGCGSEPVCRSSLELEYEQRLADCER